MKRMRKRNTISGMLWKSYLFMVLVSIVMVIVPYIICIFFSAKLNQIESYKNCRAVDLMQDDYQKIDVAKIRDMNGSVQVVTKDLEVITLCGSGVISQEKLSNTEWTEFLIQSGNVNDIERDIAYNESEKFWLIVELPIARIQMKFVVNQDLVEYNKITLMLWLMFISYFGLVIFSAICYSRITAAGFRRPFQKLCDYANMLEQGCYEKRIELEGLVEFKNL